MEEKNLKNKKSQPLYLKYIIQISIGILLIYPFRNNDNWLRFIALGGFLLIMKNLIAIVINSEQILSSFFPTATFTQNKFLNNALPKISITIFFIGLTFILFEVNNLEKVVNELSIWLILGLCGVLFSVLLLVIIYRTHPSTFNNTNDRYSIVFGLIIGLSLISIAGTSFINRINVNTSTNVYSTIIERKSQGGDVKKSHWIFVQVNNSQKRFRVNLKIWNKMKEGQKVNLHLKKGNLNFMTVEKITIK